jgi:Prp8 binding protein
VRPFCTGERCTKVFTGHTHNFEKNLLHCAWSPDAAMVAAGSADRNVNVWDVESQKLVYKLPGHLGSVNDVDFHSVEPIILSVGSDKNIYLGEFEP